MSLYINTFDSVDGNTVKLGAITANSLDDSDGEFYNVFDWTGFVPFLDFIQTMNKNGKFTGQYSYAPAGYAGENVAGWYDYTDKACTTLKNDVEIPFAQGFYLNTSDGNGGLAPAITFAGAVKQESTVVPVAISMMLSGNASPVDIKLGAITANSLDDSDGEFYEVFDWTGFVPFLDFIQIMNESGQFIGQYTYAPAGYAGSNEAGWYEFTDKGCTKCMNDIDIKAGQSFYVNAGDGNGGLAPTITLPSAL